MSAIDYEPALPSPVEDETEQRPMTDREHRRVFGWSWDDPDEGE